MLDDDQEAFGAALIWKGKDPNAGAADEIETVKQVYAAIRPPHPHLQQRREGRAGQRRRLRGDGLLRRHPRRRRCRQQAAEAAGKPAPDIRRDPEGRRAALGGRDRDP
ncbi:MAG: hypothetical protein IPH90_03170 [Thermomonas sp.]|nr:hypothetical protein [Thermomonas sp.]